MEEKAEEPEEKAKRNLCETLSVRRGVGSCGKAWQKGIL